MQAPPLLPPTRLARALAIARADAWSVIGIGGLSLVWLVVQRAWGMAGLAGCAVAAGFVELHGRRELLRGRAGGRAWLMLAQLALLALLCGYAWYRSHHFDAAALWAQLPGFYQTWITNQLLAQGYDPEWAREDLLHTANNLLCALLPPVALLYQGGLTIYYQRNAVLPES